MWVTGCVSVPGTTVCACWELALARICISAAPRAGCWRHYNVGFNVTIGVRDVTLRQVTTGPHRSLVCACVLSSPGSTEQQRPSIIYTD